jgi:hypothetical protein
VMYSYSEMDSSVSCSVAGITNHISVSILLPLDEVWMQFLNCSRGDFCSMNVKSVHCHEVLNVQIVFIS